MKRSHPSPFGFRARVVWATIFVCSFATLTQADAPKEKPYGSSEEIEKMLAGWRPSKEKRDVPQKELRSGGTNIEGVWEINRGNLEFSRLTLTRSGPGTFVVELYHTCCVTGWKLTRQGRFDKGVLTLDRPITESYGEKYAYRTLHAVKIDGVECLLPENAVAEVEESLAEQTKRFQPGSAESQRAFRKAERENAKP